MVPKQRLDKEKTIIKQCKRDRKAFKKLYQMYYTDIFRYLRSMVNSAEQAEDLAQETFITAYKKIEQFEWRGTSIKSWFIGIARMKAYESFSKNDIELSLGNEKVEEVDNLTIDRSLEVETELVVEIESAMEKLKPKEREVIALKVWEEYTFVEIAEMTDTKESTVKMRFYRSVEKLKEILEEEHGRKKTAFPVLFAGIHKVGFTDTYKPTGEIPKFSSIEKMNLIEKFKATISSMSTSAKVAAVTGVVLTAGVTTVAVMNMPDSAEVQDDVTDNTIVEEDTSEESSLNTDDEEVTKPEETDVDKSENEEDQKKEQDSSNDDEVTTPVPKPEPEPTNPEPTPQPTSYTFTGNYISATVPNDWSVVEKDPAEYGVTGFGGFEIKNANGTLVFKMYPAVATGFGSMICDYDHYYAFSDDEPGRYDEILASKQDKCDPDATITKHNLTADSNVNLLGNRYRRVGTDYFYDYEKGDSYFQTEDSAKQETVSTASAGGSLTWNDGSGASPYYYPTFYGSGSQLDSVLNSVSAR
jgi:RNA polymerase sigma-70 factor (ECF subfamily)